MGKMQNIQVISEKLEVNRICI